MNDQTSSFAWKTNNSNPFLELSEPVHQSINESVHQLPQSVQGGRFTNIRPAEEHVLGYSIQIQGCYHTTS